MTLRRLVIGDRVPDIVGRYQVWEGGAALPCPLPIARSSARSLIRTLEALTLEFSVPEGPRALPPEVQLFSQQVAIPENPLLRELSKSMQGG